jgi:hypothetical protein
MTVKNINKYHNLSHDELNKLGTRELVNALESSRGRIICSCGKGHHCGDEVLDQDEKAWNQSQSALYSNLKDILKDREDVTRREVPRKAEKKKMKY